MPTLITLTLNTPLDTKPKITINSDHIVSLQTMVHYWVGIREPDTVIVKLLNGDTIEVQETKKQILEMIPCPIS